MIKQNYNVIGVMSGTSLDGVDLANIFFSYDDGRWAFDIHEAATIPYNEEWVKRLQNAVSYNQQELEELDEEYTVLLGNIIKGFINENSIAGIDAVCSHGHTILHQPHNKLTLQIGNRHSLADSVNQKIICNFRIEDVAMGGQGAPLVPIGDKILFSDYSFCLNLGGFSNISFDAQGRRIAYDICAVNTVLNHYSNLLGFHYDDKGAIAASGNVYQPLLEKLNALEFYKMAYPKSLGFEYVKGTIIPLIDNYSITVQDKLATYTEHIAVQLAAAVTQEEIADSILITGGGAYNKFLIRRLSAFLPHIRISIPDDKTIQFKEALIFGLLGVLRLRGEINVLSSVTGAPEDHCAGYIFDPK